MVPLLLTTLLIATDPHLLAPELHDNGTAFVQYAASSGGRDLERNQELWEAFLKVALEQKPEAVLVTGDLTNQGEKLSHRLVAEGLARLKKAGIRPLVVPGNHDINNPYARALVGTKQLPAESVTPEEFVEVYRDAGYGDALERDTGSLSYLVALNPRQWILMLDTAVYDLNSVQGYPEVRGVLTDTSLAWIAHCGERARAAGAQLIAAGHHNFTNHALLTDGFTLDNASEAAAALTKAGVRLTLSGHIHVQDIDSTVTPSGRLYDVVTNALSTFPNHYGRLTWSETGALVYDALPVTLMGSALEAHSRAAFRAGITRRAPEGARELMATLNENYFSGHEERNRALADGAEFHTLEATSGFLGPYVKSMLADHDDLPDNHLELK